METLLEIIENLSPPELWNLAMAYPETFVRPVLNVFVTDAVRQFLFDHPSGQPDDWPEDEDDMPDERDRPPSLLLWLGRRVTYDSAFRETWRERILEVVDTYLEVYGRQNPPPGVWGRLENMLFYFRDPNPNPPGNRTTRLMHAAWDLRPDATHLILLRGGADVNVNESAFDAPNWTPLSEAAMNATSDLDDPDGMQVIFALIGAGADVAAVREPGRTRSGRNLRPFMGEAPALEDVWNYDWPVVQNLFGSTVREFIANDRAPYHQRLLLAMFAIYTGSLDYPAFI